MPQSQDPSAAYELRLKDVERQNAIMKGAVAILAVLFIVNLIISWPRSSRTVSAGEFDLRDATGAVRAKLGMLPGGPGLELYAASGEERATLVGAAEDSYLNLYVPVTASAGSTASINLFDGTQQIAWLSGGPSSTMLKIDSATGNVAASLNAQDGFALMGLEANGESDATPRSVAPPKASCFKRADAADEKPVPLGAMICLDSQSRPVILLNDQEGKSLWSAPK